MKRIGLFKRVHLNRMLLQSYFAGKRLRDLRFMLSRCYLMSKYRQVLPAQRLPLRLLRLELQKVKRLFESVVRSSRSVIK
jgi:hypothetical protein